MIATDTATIARALALIGTPREVCEKCGAPTRAGTKFYGGMVHTARSAALTCGLDPQVVYRAVRKAKPA